MPGDTRLRALRPAGARGAWRCSSLAFLATAALALIPALTHDSLHTIYERTVAYQANRGSPFSIWGLYGLHGAEQVVELLGVVLALGLALIPRREDLVGLASACAAIMIAVELAMEHWFYLYIPWFFPLVLLALFEVPARLPPRPSDHLPAGLAVSEGELPGAVGPTPSAEQAVWASEPARSNQPEAVLSS